jgi:hypothetical protein
MGNSLKWTNSILLTSLRISMAHLTYHRSLGLTWRFNPVKTLGGSARDVVKVIRSPLHGPTWLRVGLILVLSSVSSHAGSMSCAELSDFVVSVSIARSLNPSITPERMKKIIREDESYSANERRLLSKYVDRSFTKADPADGILVPIDTLDCRK